ncbi:hypothetical protein L249_6007 [Ophiocordyceps polyrhachis-furcata BCC 54312]|uniref:Histidine acid phosphatase n=1 Tax=Ophiocordyceps polyrhachis-furcata BCC 54312 TaxID=1330021 RepID=A0A367LJ06_9HYPO|nr:hypothetical protein L249_6007 [Ophiocordyceps polyrhachis-furcata BCC 54312]
MAVSRLSRLKAFVTIIATTSGVTNPKWFAPSLSDVNNLTSATLCRGNCSGLGNWCNEPRVRPSNYAPPTSEFELQYVELIHRHHKRTPYASNSFPVDSNIWNCDDASILHLIHPLRGPQPAVVYRQELRPYQNSWKSPNRNASCAFPQITTDGLLDSWQHGNDLYDVYHGLVGLLPSRNEDAKSVVRYRATNNVITQQVAAMVIGGMWRDSGPFPLLIQPSGIDSLEPQYDCPAANERFSSIVSNTNTVWRKHLVSSTQLFRTLDNITLVHPLDPTFHSSFDHYFDNLSARQCHSMPMPCRPESGSKTPHCVSQEVADAVFRIGHWEYNHIYRDHPSSLLASAASFGSWIGELTTNLRDSMNGSSKIVYSHNVAHDGSIARLLSILQFEYMRWPGMGAEIVFELYRRKSKPSRHRPIDGDTPVRRQQNPPLAAANCLSGSMIPRARTCSPAITPTVASQSASGTLSNLGHPDNSNFYLRLLFDGQPLKSSNPSLGVIDMVPVDTVLEYFDNLVGKEGGLVESLCQTC